MFDDSTWERIQSGDLETRNAVVEHYLPLVHRIASKMKRTLFTPTVSDMVSYGTFGLIYAVERYDPTKGAQFETYAHIRIRGAIIDEVRKDDWVPRSIRTESRNIDKAKDRLTASRQRTVSSQELAEELGLTLDELGKRHQPTSTSYLFKRDPMDASTQSRLGSDVGLVHVADNSIDLDQEARRSEFSRFVGETLGWLSEQEQIILALYYVKRLSLAEIGDLLGVTVSRVCQIQTAAIMSFRSRLTDRLAC